MKTIPILFSTPMVQALLSGQKTMTRREKGLKHLTDHYFQSLVLHATGRFTFVKNGLTNPKAEDVIEVKPPCMPGDILWVREKHFAYGIWIKNGKTKTGKQKWKFSKDMAYTSIAYFDNPPKQVLKNTEREVYGWFKRSSLFMPKEACRLFLKVKSVRVERLKDISRGDAMDEGCPFSNMAAGPNPVNWFSDLWKSINGEQSWNDNPWVWVVEFEKTAKPDDF